MTLKLTPYLIMDGNAREAIQFYEKVLHAEVTDVQTYGDMPMACPDALKHRVAYALLRIGESELMLMDARDERVHDGDKVSICLATTDVEETKRIHEALKKDGTEIAPLGKTPFSPSFGSVLDKFGVTFIVVTQV